MFKTAPVERRAGGSTGSSKSNSGSTSIQEMVGQAGNRVLGGLSIQEMLKGSGISLSPSGGFVLGGQGQDDDDEDEEEEEEEDEKVSLLFFPSFFLPFFLPFSV